MDVSQTTFTNLISSADTQYIIPNWQRRYSWADKEWSDIWRDLIQLHDSIQQGSSATNEHFLGSLVVKTAEHKVGQSMRLIVIDGQQRLTTLLIIAGAIREAALRSKDGSLAEKIEDVYLMNKHADDEEHRHKLFPSYADRHAFDSVLRGAKLTETDSRTQIAKAHKFFYKRINQLRDIDLRALLNTMGFQFRMVIIRLDATDNPKRIFETLNYRGKSLEPSDLVRNYIMMILPEKEANKIHREQWIPMEDNLSGESSLKTAENVSDFFRHFIIPRTKEPMKREMVYESMRNIFDGMTTSQQLDYLREASHSSEFYGRILKPSLESEVSIRRGLERIRRLRIGVAHPFLLRVYNAYEGEHLSKSQFEEILLWIESYFIRRLASGFSTHPFTGLFAWLSQDSLDGIYSHAKKYMLSKDETKARWPTDKEFREIFPHFPLYTELKDRCRFILETLEVDFGHPERPNLANLTVEHIMPQHPSPEWKRSLGSGWEEIHRKYVHTIGNLTLIDGSRNTSISELPYKDKVEKWYSESNVAMTKQLTQRWSGWGPDQIRERSEILTRKALRLWPRPKISID